MFGMVAHAKKKSSTILSRDEARQRLAANFRRLLGDELATAFSERTGLCYRTLRLALTGKVDPSMSFAVSLAGALGVTVEDLTAPPPKKSRA